jgi:uncharacterized protein (DUF952 family)
VPTIFHIASRSDWRVAREHGEYRLSTRDRSLEEVGFIHCADADQVLRIADAVYGDVDETLVVLEVSTDALDVEVRYENLDGGRELFPHIYGVLPVHAVTSVTPLRRGSAGGYSFDQQGTAR